MRLFEIEASNAAEQRVKQLKAGARAAKNKAAQMKAQADSSAEQLDLQKSQQKLAQLRNAAVSTNIQPYR